MTSRTPARRHDAEFKLQLCRDIRSGAIGRREAQRLYRLSDNLIHRWLAQYDAKERQAPAPPPPASSHAEYEAKIAVLERKVGQLTMALERCPRCRHCDWSPTGPAKGSGASK